MNNRLEGDSKRKNELKEWNKIFSFELSFSRNLNFQKFAKQILYKLIIIIL